MGITDVKIRLPWIVAAVLTLGLMVKGCGSGSKVAPSPSTGRATITVRWPDEVESRLIPVRANSIRVRITDEVSFLAGEAVLTRANPSATFNTLPTGTLTVVANAYPETNGTGVSQATATAPLVIVANTNTPITMTLASTITRLDITPTSSSVLVGGTQPFAATARNAAGEIVLTTPSTLQWAVTPGGATSVGGGDAASITNAGVLTALKPGATTLTVRENESGVRASRALSITTNIAVTIAPATVTISPWFVVNLTASLSNVPNGADSGVIWSTTGGSITQTGVFTAPEAVGVYTVTATSKFDPSKFGTRNITVKNGTVNVEVD